MFTWERLVTFPRKEARFSFKGEVGAEVVLLLGRPPAAVISAPSLDTELGSGVSRGEVSPSPLNLGIYDFLRF